MFNAQDLKNLQIFLKRVDLKGNESMAHAELLIKTSNLLQIAENPVPAKIEEKPSKPEIGKNSRSVRKAKK